MSYQPYENRQAMEVETNAPHLITKQSSCEQISGNVVVKSSSLTISNTNFTEKNPVYHRVLVATLKEKLSEENNNEIIASMKQFVVLFVVNNQNTGVTVEETFKWDEHGRVIEVNYTFDEVQSKDSMNHAQRYQGTIARSEYDRLAASLQRPSLPFDYFIKVLRPFMMGKYASEDIAPAFQLLDTDRSGTIDIGELAAFMPVIRPDANPHMLLSHIQKADKNADYKLNFDEFKALLMAGIGRDIILGRA